MTLRHLGKKPGNIRHRFLLIGLLLLAPGIDAALPAGVDGHTLPSLAPMLEKAMPAVVNISTRTEIRMREHPLMRDPLFRHFFGIPDQPSRRQRHSLGSGVIIDARRGYVLTNNHVIDKADEIMVTLQDGRQLNAKLVGTDPAADIAVIKIPTDQLTEIPIADSDRARVGDFVVAIGNPFGLGQTATSGIISALGRSGLGIEGYEDFIQTDASINPGNSGGALVDLRGELIGINTAILAPSGGNVGIGFAIPSNMAIKLKNSLVRHGEVRRGLLGVTVQDLTPELVRAFGLTRKHGAVISRVESGSPAERAGLEPGDVIIAVNRKRIKNSSALRNAIGLLQIGDRVRLEVIQDGQNQIRTAVIGKPNIPEVAGKTIHPALAGTVLSPTSRSQVDGVSIAKVRTSSYAWRAGLRPGDIIVIANRYRVNNLAEFRSVADQHRPLMLNIQRGSEAFFVILR